MRKIIFRTLGIICFAIMCMQFSPSPTESITPVIIAVISAAASFACFVASEVEW